MSKVVIWLGTLGLVVGFVLAALFLVPGPIVKMKGRRWWPPTSAPAHSTPGIHRNRDHGVGLRRMRARHGQEEVSDNRAPSRHPSRAPCRARG